MAKQIKFHPEARVEFENALNWYTDRSNMGALGFTAEVDIALEKIRAHPELFSRTVLNCQSCSLQRYPYCIIFKVSMEQIYILAIAHSKRRPGYWTLRRE
jgi:plasmid stabilization system protein ParE